MTEKMNPAGSGIDLDHETLWEIHGVVKNAGSTRLAHKIADAIARRAPSPHTGTGQDAEAAVNAGDLEDRIVELRTALRQISETRFGYDGDCGVTKIADDALYADEQAEASKATAASASEQARRAASGGTDLAMGERARAAGEAVRDAVHAITGPGFQLRLAGIDFASIISKALAHQAGAPVAAWMTEDGERVVSAATKSGQERDGGASASAMRPFSVALVRAAPAGAKSGADDARDAARYRWLREQPFDTWKRIAWNTWNDEPAVFPIRDEDIDAAMAASPASADQGDKNA